MLFLVVLRTSRHPHSASLLQQELAIPFALDPAFPAFSILVETQYSHVCL